MKFHLTRVCLVGFSLLALAPATQAQNTALEADEVTLDDASGKIQATGNVELTYGATRLTGDMIYLDRSQESVSVPGPFRLKQADGSVLTAKGAELNTRLDSGLFEDLHITMPQSGRMSAARAEDTPDALRLQQAIFTSCDECPTQDGDPLWQIRASEIDYDRVGQNMVYRHPRLEVYGLPVFYLPYLAHAGPEVDRRSGFLAPRLASSGDFGTAVETPYFLDLAPNYDLTLSPRIGTKQDPFITGEWRHLTESGSYNLTAYIHQPRAELSEDTSRETRLGLVGSGRFRLAEWDLDFALQDASDDLFFKRYDISNTNRLTNRLSLSRSFTNQNITLETYHFRNTLKAEEDSTVDRILPSLTQQIYFDADIFGGDLSMTNRLTHETRKLGTDVTHLTSRLDWTWQHRTTGGFVLSARNRFVMDGYQYDAESWQMETADEFLAANATAFTLAYPLRRIGAKTTQLLTPKAQIVLATENDDYADIPYIDGTSIDLSRAQLFNALATKDEASRFNFGLLHKLDSLSGLRTEFFIGQSLNLSDMSYAPKTGYGDDRSALLIDMAVHAGAFSVSQQARYDETGSQLLRSESRAALHFDSLKFGLTHSFYEVGQNGLSALDEATASLDWQLSDMWHISASFRENLETEKRVEELTSLTYEDECTLLQLSLSRDYSEVAGIEADTSINFTFTLKTIGGMPAPR